MYRNRVSKAHEEPGYFVTHKVYVRPQTHETPVHALGDVGGGGGAPSQMRRKVPPGGSHPPGEMSLTRPPGRVTCPYPPPLSAPRWAQKGPQGPPPPPPLLDPPPCPDGPRWASRDPPLPPVGQPPLAIARMIAEAPSSSLPVRGADAIPSGSRQGGTSNVKTGFPG